MQPAVSAQLAMGLFTVDAHVGTCELVRAESERRALRGTDEIQSQLVAIRALYHGMRQGATPESVGLDWSVIIFRCFACVNRLSKTWLRASATSSSKGESLGGCLDR